MTLLILSQTEVGKSLVLQSVPLRIRSCSKISVKDIRKIIKSWVSGKNLLIHFTLLTLAFSRQYYFFIQGQNETKPRNRAHTEGQNEDKRMTRKGKGWRWKD